jgi:Fe-S-cluster containining protein
MNDVKVTDLLEFYKELELVFSEFQKTNELSCPEGCGSCCLYPEIEASPVEMLPMAAFLIKENKAEEFLSRLEGHPQRCVAYQAQSLTGEKGTCGAYQYRPTICRMFGVAGVSSKDHSTKYSICGKLKAEKFKEVQRLESERPAPPMMHEWTHKLLRFDPDVLAKRQPINLALKEALLKLLYLEDLHKNSMVTLSSLS